MPSIKQIRELFPNLQTATDATIVDLYAKDYGLDPQAAAAELGYTPPTVGRALARGFSSGIDQLQGSVYGLGGAVSGAVGATPVQRWMEEQAARNQEESMAAGIRDLENVEDQSLGSAAPYAAYQIAKQGPLIASLVGSSLIPGGQPAALARLGAMAPRALGGGGGIGLEAGATAAARQAALRQGAGMARMVETGAGLGAGEMYNESVEAGDASPYKALAMGLPYGMLEAAVPGAVSGVFRRGAEGAFRGGLATRMAKGAALGFGGEAGTEVLQNEMEMSFNPNLTPEQIASRRLNAIVAGGLVGGSLGSLTGLPGRREIAAAQTRSDLTTGNPVDLTGRTITLDELVGDQTPGQAGFDFGEAPSTEGRGYRGQPYRAPEVSDLTNFDDYLSESLRLKTEYEQLAKQLSDEQSQGGRGTKARQDAIRQQMADLVEGQQSLAIQAQQARGFGAPAPLQGRGFTVQPQASLDFNAPAPIPNQFGQYPLALPDYAPRNYTQQLGLDMGGLQGNLPFEEPVAPFEERRAQPEPVDPRQRGFDFSGGRTTDMFSGQLSDTRQETPGVSNDFQRALAVGDTRMAMSIGLKAAAKVGKLKEFRSALAILTRPTQFDNEGQRQMFDAPETEGRKAEARQVLLSIVEEGDTATRVDEALTPPPVTLTPEQRQAERIKAAGGKTNISRMAQIIDTGTRVWNEAKDKIAKLKKAKKGGITATRDDAELKIRLLKDEFDKAAAKRNMGKLMELAEQMSFLSDAIPLPEGKTEKQDQVLRAAHNLYRLGHLTGGEMQTIANDVERSDFSSVEKKVSAALAKNISDKEQRQAAQERFRQNQLEDAESSRSPAAVKETVNLHLKNLTSGYRSDLNRLVDLASIMDIAENEEDAETKGYAKAVVDLIKEKVGQKKGQIANSAEIMLAENRARRMGTPIEDIGGLTGHSAAQVADFLGKINSSSDRKVLSKSARRLDYEGTSETSAVEFMMRDILAEMGRYRFDKLEPATQTLLVESLSTQYGADVMEVVSRYADNSRMTELMRAKFSRPDDKMNRGREYGNKKVAALRSVLDKQSSSPALNERRASLAAKLEDLYKLFSRYTAREATFPEFVHLLLSSQASDALYKGGPNKSATNLALVILRKDLLDAKKDKAVAAVAEDIRKAVGQAKEVSEATQEAEDAALDKKVKALKESIPEVDEEIAPGEREVPAYKPGAVDTSLPQIDGEPYRISYTIGKNAKGQLVVESIRAVNNLNETREESVGSLKGQPVRKALEFIGNLIGKNHPALNEMRNAVEKNAVELQRQEQTKLEAKQEKPEPPSATQKVLEEIRKRKVRNIERRAKYAKEKQRDKTGEGVYAGAVGQGQSNDGQQQPTEPARKADQGKSAKAKASAGTDTQDNQGGLTAQDYLEKNAEGRWVASRPIPADMREEVIDLQDSLNASLSQTEARGSTTIDAIRNALRAWFVSPLQLAKKVEIVATEADLPKEVQALVEERRAQNPELTTQGATWNGRVYLVAAGIAPGTERAVFMHEVGTHLGMTEEEINNAAARIKRWAASPVGSIERKVHDAALARMEASLVQSDSELVAYAVEEAVLQGQIPSAVLSGRSKTFNKVQEFVVSYAKMIYKKIQSFIGLVKPLSAQDLVDFAYGAAQIALDRQGVTNAAPALSQVSGRTTKTIFQKMKARAYDNFRAGLVRSVFGHDLVKIAAKLGLTEATEFYNLVAKKDVIRNQYENEVAKIMEGTVELKDRAEAEQFLRDSTRKKKWGYADNPMGAEVDPAMETAFNKLTKESQEKVKEIFAFGHKSYNEMIDELTADIRGQYDEMLASATTAEEKKQLEKDKRVAVNKVRRMMPQLDGPYAPLKRFGDHVVISMSPQYEEALQREDTKRMEELIGKPDELHYKVEMFENAGDAEAARDEMQQKYPDWDVTYTLKKDGSASEELAWKQIQKITLAVKASDSTHSAAMQRLITDIYLQSLAESSARKAQIGRKGVGDLSGVAGSADMFRAFAAQGESMAHYMASLKGNRDINKQISLMRQQLNVMSKKVDRTPEEKNDAKEAERAFQEIMARYNQSIDRRPTPWADKAMKVASIWMLATSPAYYLQNSMQTFMFTRPLLAGRFGEKANGVIFDAYKDVVAATYKMSGELDIDAMKNAGKITDTERQMLQALWDSGKLTLGLNTEKGRWTSDASVKPNALDKSVRWLDHKMLQVEVLNRVTAALASFRLNEQDQRQNKPNSTKYAGDVVDQTHGNYAGFNAPRFFSANAGMKLVTQFRKYQLIQLSLLIGLAKNSTVSLKGLTGVELENAKGERAAQRAALAYLITQHLMITGMAGTVPVALLALAGMFGADEGDDEDWERRARKWIGDDDTANLLLRGIPAYLGVDLSQKLGISKAFSLLPFADIPKDKSSYEKAVVSASGAFIGGLGSQMFDAIGYMGKGDYYKGVETALPRGFRDAARAYRYFEEGITDRKGTTVLAADEIGGAAAFSQLIGLPTTTITEMSRQRGALYELGQHFKARSAELKADYINALKDKDTGEMADIRKTWMDMQKQKTEWLKEMQRQGFKNEKLMPYLKAAPLSTLLKAPQEQAKREGLWAR